MYFDFRKPLEKLPEIEANYDSDSSTEEVCSKLVKLWHIYITKEITD